MRTLALLSAAILCACAASAVGQEGVRIEKSSKVVKAPLIFQVAGEAESQPETVTIRFTVVGDGDSLTAAQEQAQSIEKAVIKAVEKLGVKESGVALETFVASPVQPMAASSSASSLKPIGYRVIRSYHISQAVSSNSLDRLMQIADAALSQGARPAVGGSIGYDGYDRSAHSLFEFAVKDPDKLKKQALDAGLALARKMAEQAAEKMGIVPANLKLVGVKLTEGDRGYGSFGGDEGPADKVWAWHPIKSTVMVEAAFDVK